MASLLEKVGRDLTNWMDLPLTLLGRINAVKMNILPKFLYMFQSLLISISKSFFTTLNGLIRSFIWHRKTPMVSLDKLALDYNQGGLRLPNFKMYYWAAQSRYLAQMFTCTPFPSWLNMEKFEMKEECPTNLLYTWDDILIKRKTSNPMIIHSVQTWNKLRSLLGQANFLSPKTPLWGNRMLPMCHQNKNCRIWFEKGITHLEHCFDDGILMSFEQLKKKYNLSNKDFFLVICNYEIV